MFAKPNIVSINVNTVETFGNKSLTQIRAYHIHKKLWIKGSIDSMMTVSINVIFAHT